MSVALIVMYKGQPEDPDAFLRYYTEKHIPIVRTFPKIRGIYIERGVEDVEYFMFSRLVFDSLDDLHKALESQQREKARQDMANFPIFNGEVKREIVEIMPIIRKNVIPKLRTSVISFLLLSP